MEVYIVLQNGKLYKPLTKFYQSENKARASLIAHLENEVWKKRINKQYPELRVKEIAIKYFLPQYEIVEFVKM